MAGLDLNGETGEAFAARIRGIRSVEQRRWGRLTPAGVLAHLDLMLRLSLGETKMRGVRLPVVGSLFYLLFFRVFTTWPKGLLWAPAAFFPHDGPDTDAELEASRSACLESLERFVAAVSENPEALAPHPFLGKVSLRQWARIHGVHFDHHLRQFGV